MSEKCNVMLNSTYVRFSVLEDLNRLHEVQMCHQYHETFHQGKIDSGLFQMVDLSCLYKNHHQKLL